MSQAIGCGISRCTLYDLLDQGIVERVSRGIYRMTELPPISNPDLAIVGLRFPKAVICTVSALAYHEITTQIPRSVHVAVLRESRQPHLEYPPLRAHRFSGVAFHSGIEEHQIGGASVRIYSLEKTLADCFKLRNKIGIDVALEAIRLYKARKHTDISAIMSYAKICRVENVMHPYLEAIF